MAAPAPLPSSPLGQSAPRHSISKKRRKEASAAPPARLPPSKRERDVPSQPSLKGGSVAKASSCEPRAPSHGSSNAANSSESRVSDGAPILSFFWDLASVDSSKRVRAGDELLCALLRMQSSETEPSADLTYTIKRLVRGLASSRDAARQGFGAVLIEVLVAFSSLVRIEDVLDLMDATMQLHGAMDGNEERDMLFGRLFTCASVLRCSLLPDLSEDRKERIATRVSKELLFCFGKKTFLQEMAVSLISELISQLPPAETQRLVWPHVAPLLSPPIQDWSAHALFLALRLCRALPAATIAALLPHASPKAGTILHLANLPVLVAPLKAASVVHPRVHCVWGEVLSLVCGDRDAVVSTASGGEGGVPIADIEEKASVKSSKGKKKRKEAAAADTSVTESVQSIDESLLRAFWQHVVEEGLVPSTLERKYMAFMLLQQVVHPPSVHLQSTYFLRTRQLGSSVHYA